MKIKFCDTYEVCDPRLMLLVFMPEMQSMNESCTVGPSITYLTCLLHLCVEWLELENLEDYLNYVDYLLWVFTPLIIVFILPFFIFFFLYLSILFLHVYKRKNELKEAYSNSIWDGARKTLASLWDGHATIWHGYEIHGLENIPDEGPALIVYYHGALPVDYYYFVAKVILLKGRTCQTVGDHFLFKIPGKTLWLHTQHDIVVHNFKAVGGALNLGDVQLQFSTPSKQVGFSGYPCFKKKWL
ncbi:hypothetical protein FKM82_006115 [Ascaphus truei]